MRSAGSEADCAVRSRRLAEEKREMARSSDWPSPSAHGLPPAVKSDASEQRLRLLWSALPPVFRTLARAPLDACTFLTAVASGRRVVVPPRLYSSAGLLSWVAELAYLRVNGRRKHYLLRPLSCYEDDVRKRPFQLAAGLFRREVSRERLACCFPRPSLSYRSSLSRDPP